MGFLRRAVALTTVAFVAACSGTTSTSDAGATTDIGPVDAGPIDVGPADTGAVDAGPNDTGVDAGSTDVASQDIIDHDGHTLDVGVDTGPTDTGPTDTGSTDTGPIDTGPTDTGPTDTGPIDTGPTDTGPTDTGPTDTGPTDTGPADTGPADVGCVNTQTDPNNCGGCGRVCCAGSVCSAGACVLGCSAGNTACPPTTPPVGCFGGGTCRDLQTDNANCGACGNACPSGQVCVAGACQAPFTAVAPCNAPGDYTAGSTVRFGSLGTAYEPRCLTVRVGDSVTFEGSFAGHPLAPSTRGTSGTPIARTAAGTTATFRFTAAGHFPYFCEFHGSNAGDGMSGVVRVVE